MSTNIKVIIVLVTINALAFWREHVVKSHEPVAQSLTASDTVRMDTITIHADTATVRR